MDDDLLTTTQAAERLRVTPRVVRRWIAEGRLVPRTTTPGARGASLLAATDVDRLRLELLEAARQRAADLEAAAS